MTKPVENAQAIAILAGVGVALYLGYKVYKGGAAISDTASRVADSITGAANSAGQLIVDTGAKIKNAIGNAYAETATFISGQQHYSPEALNGSMSRQDAIDYAIDLEKATEARETQAYENMVAQEQYSLLRRYPADNGSDPSLPFIGYAKP